VVAEVTQDAPAGQAVRVRVLGEFSITTGDLVAGSWPRPSARRLCALLAVSPGHRVSRDLACEELFPRLEPRAAARSLSKALSMARAALSGLGDGGAALLGADLTHVWLSPHVVVDADVQGSALRAGLVLAPGEVRDETLSGALADDGVLLPDEPYADWADRARDQLNSLRQEARLALARDRAKGAGRSGPDDVTAAWLACLDHDPACEEAAGALIRAFLGQGRPEQAARVFERCRAALEALGLRISPSLERVHASAMAARAVTPSVPPAVPSVQSVPSASLDLGTPYLTTGPAAPPREERRPVTVLFAEVAAPQGLTGTLGLEELRDLVGGSLASVIAEVEALGGTVSSVSGRGLQAMFGAPEAHEDDPERALRAAYRAMTAAGAVPASAVPAGATPASAVPAGPVPAGPVSAGPVPANAVPARQAATARPGLRIGIESGPALVGPIGGGAKVEYAALGDVVSVAAALQSAARPGSVLVGPATRAAAAHLFTWGPDEPLALSPDAAPLAAGYLDAPRATAAERRPRLGGRAPLVGRQAELRALDTALRAAVAGHGQVIVLSGEPGIGKTRLVQESRKRFIAWVGAGSGRRPLWLEGRGASYASATPYGLYRQLIASWIGVAADQSSERVRAALDDALTHLMGNTNLLGPLAHLMGLPQPATPGHGDGQARRKPSPEEQQRQVFAAVRALVTRFTAVAPAVLVLEDLHWADPTSLRLTAELAELTASRPLLLLATTRPGAGLPPRVSGPAPAHEIRLRPLGEAAAGALAMSLIGQVGGPEVLAAILADAEGNPLFLEERLAEMLEAEVLVRQQGAWRLPGPARQPASQVALPQVLERLVRSRADRLSPAAAEAIRAASVLGTEFTADVLAATLGARPSALAAVLDELCASDLVHHEPPGSAKPSFRFRHALIQEAVYLALLRNDRRALHARAARALEVACECQLAEVATVLGRHYAIAEEASRAVRFLELGGDRATDAFANDEAIASFREALTMTAQAAGVGARGPAGDAGSADDMLAAAVRLQAKLANVLWRTARFDEARTAFQKALGLADAGSPPLDPVLRAHLHIRLGRLEMTGMRYREAAAAFDAAEALLGDNAGQADDATADHWLELMVDGRADLHVMRFEPDLALAMLERARPVLEARGTPARRTAFCRAHTMQRLLRNRLRVDEEDIGSLRAGIIVAGHTGEDKDVGYATHFLGWALWIRGELPEAAVELTKALRLAERTGETHLRDLALLTLTLTALRRHDTEAVRALLPQAIAALRETGDHAPGRIAGAMACAAWLAWQDGRPDEVTRLAAEIETQELTSIGSGARYRWVYLFPLLAARLQAGQLDAATAAARQLIDPSQMRLPDDLTAALAQASDSWANGNQTDTAHRLATVLTLATANAYF
jgi:class 3 adenylate cyclase/DNA-binding SARP family transcriptional activator/tetratricopeptide (TPR) repeat protein